MADFEANRRLKKIIEEDFKMTPFAFSQKYGDNGGVKTSAIMRERNGISSKMLDKIIDAYPEINRSWILTGEGVRIRHIGGIVQSGSRNIMISGGHNRNVGNHGTVYGSHHDGDTSNKGDDRSLPNDGEPYTLVPVYNFDAVGGMHSSNDVTDSPAFVERHVPFVGARKEDICVNVTGNSMAPTYCSGSLLLLREVQNWAEYFGYGHCYVIFLKDGRRILKEVQRFAENSKEYVLCVSHNKDYPPEELPKSMITAVYKVIMTLTNDGF